MQVQSRNLQVKNKGVIIGGTKEGPTSRSPDLLSETFETGVKSLVIISKNLQVNSRNFQVKIKTPTIFQSIFPSPDLLSETFKTGLQRFKII